jgi:hypothetical protein
VIRFLEITRPDIQMPAAESDQEKRLDRATGRGPL